MRGGLTHIRKRVMRTVRALRSLPPEDPMKETEMVRSLIRKVLSGDIWYLLF